MNARLHYLFDRHIRKACTAAERQELMDFLSEPMYELQLKELIGEEMENGVVQFTLSGEAADEVFEQVIQVDKPARVIVMEAKPATRRKIVWAAAAAVLVAVAAGGYLWLTNQLNHKAALTNNNNQVQKNENTGVTGKSVLMLADGSAISLDNAGNGMLAQQEGTVITREGEQLVYAQPKQGNETTVLYNTVVTARGGKQQITLPDGSKVWLSAASTLRFPTRFTGTERTVTLNGEAYFEVVKNLPAAGASFTVNANEVLVEVLGTHFNVMAYSDENAIKTTLLEGSVKVTKGTESGTLKPGQQATLNKNSNKIEVITDALATEAAIAWKNNVIQFDKATIQTVMRQISRLYDVDISFAGKPTERLFNGKFRPNATISQVVEILAANDVHCKLDGKKLIVSP